MVVAQVPQGDASPVPASTRYGRASLTWWAVSALDGYLQLRPWLSLAAVPRFPPLPCARFRSFLPYLPRGRGSRSLSFMRALGSRVRVRLRAPDRAAGLHSRSFLPPCSPSRSTALPPHRGLGRSLVGRSSLPSPALVTLPPASSPRCLQPLRPWQEGGRGLHRSARGITCHSLSSFLVLVRLRAPLSWSGRQVFQ